MNISLPEPLKEFAEQQAAEKGYSTTSAYVRELIRRDQGRQQLRDLLVEGARSAPAGPADAAYFAALRDSVRG
jgi:antitoxin ParD1/3/4